jgi:cytidylate kinase
MEDILLKYMQTRMNEDKKPSFFGQSQPIVTISREFGCPSGPISQLLADKLQKRNTKKIWRILNKEILEKSANQLNLNPSKVEKVFDAEKKSTIDEILGALSSKHYKSDRVIRKTIIEVVKTYADEGYVIIVGRGGVAITRNYPNALHIRLHAPLDWRANRLSQEHNISMEEARKKAIEMDEKRTMLINDFLGEKGDHSIFDLMINCKTLFADQIVDIIIKAMESRKLI